MQARQAPPRLVVGLSLFLVLLLVGSLFIGSRLVAPAGIWNALFSSDDAELHGIVWNLRIPRTFLAAFAGASLAVAGLLAQAWTRNPLADPGFIGITSGASFMVACGMVTGWATTLGMRTVFALLGANFAAVVVLAVARRSTQPLTLILVGVGIDASLRAGATLIGLFSTDVLDAMRRWTVGSTFGRGTEDVALAGVGLAVGVVCAILAARPLDLLAMGEETSRALGSSPAVARRLAAAGVIILAGTATAATGPLAFVGFAAPHLMRRFCGPSVARLLAPTALLGANLVLLADVIGRVVMRPGELEMSIVLAIIGAPLLIYAVHRGVGWKR